MTKDDLFIDDFRVVYDLNALAAKMKARATDKMAKMMHDLAKQAEAVARPKAAAMLSALSLEEDEEQIRLDQVVFTSALLREKLSGLGRAFPYLATSGIELSQWAEGLKGVELALANTLQHEALVQVRDELEAVILKKYGLEQISAMNPGSLLAWPIMEQAPLFELLGQMPERVGVSLLPSFMMKPEHTVSGIFFQTDTKYHNCQLCPREACPNRKAPFQDH